MYTYPHMNWPESQRKYSIVTLNCKNNSEKIKEEWWTPGVAVRAKQRQEFFPSSVLSKHFILYLMTACGNHLPLFVMQWEPSLQNPQRSHTRGSSFSGRPLLLYPAFTDRGASLSQRFAAHYWTPWFLLAVGNCIAFMRRRDLKWTQTRDVEAVEEKRMGLVSSSGVPLVFSASTKALVFQYTVVETADTVAKRLCRVRSKPLRLC